MRWRGTNTRTVETDNTPGTSVYQNNTRMLVDGELQRRYGMLPSGIAQQAGPIYNIIGSNTSKGNYLTFGSPDGEDPTISRIIGVPKIPVPPFKPPKKRKPDLCAGYGPFVDTGLAASDTLNYTLPANSCAGIVVMTYVENVAYEETPWGCSFDVDIDGVNSFASDCISNDSVLFPIPAGTLTVDVTAVGGCAGGSYPGTWTITVRSL